MAAVLASSLEMNDSMSDNIRVVISAEPLPSTDDLISWASISESTTSNAQHYPCGAVVTFSGIVRDDPSPQRLLILFLPLMLSVL